VAGLQLARSRKATPKFGILSGPKGGRDTAYEKVRHSSSWQASFLKGIFRAFHARVLFSQAFIRAGQSAAMKVEEGFSYSIKRAKAAVSPRALAVWNGYEENV